MSSDNPHAVAVSRVLQDGVPVEPSEAIAILDALWAVTAPTLDDRECPLAIPPPDACRLTAFGDLEVELDAQEAQASAGPVEVTTALCRWFVQLAGSGRAEHSSWPPSVVHALEPVRAQAAPGGPVAYETPDALLAAWAWLRTADGSAALAHLYARWAVASASVPGPAMRALRQPVRAGGGVTTLPTARRRWLARGAAPVAAAVMLIVLVAGVARIRRASPDGQASAGATTRATAAPAPRAPADPGTTIELPRAAAPPLDWRAGATLAPRRLVRAADVGATPYSPSFAPSTGALLFHSGIAETGLHEASLRADGTLADVRTLVRDGANSYHVQISPDGTQMAFDSDREGERAVYVANRGGSGIRRVSGTGMALVPSWSPDGTRLAFARAEPRRPRVWQLCTVDLQTGRVQQHTSHPVGQPWGGSWFPDGRRIAYSVEDRLVLLDLHSGERRTYASPLPGRLVRTPAVSPDGTRIAFQVRGSGMWMLHVPSGQTTRVLTDRSAQEFAWSPDGRAIAYHSTRGGAWEIWAVPVSGL